MRVVGTATLKGAVSGVEAFGREVLRVILDKSAEYMLSYEVFGTKGSRG